MEYLQFQKLHAYDTSMNGVHRILNNEDTAGIYHTFFKNFTYWFLLSALTNSKDANIFVDKRYEFWRWDTLNVLFWKWWYRVPIFQWIFIDKINNNRATPTRIFENPKWNKLMLARYLKLKTIICYPFFLFFFFPV